MSDLQQAATAMGNMSGSTRRRNTWFTAIVVSVLVVIGVAGLFLFQRSTQESQDLRQQASVAQGTVLVTASPESGNFIVGQPAEIQLRVNTQGLQTDGVQLIFRAKTEGIADAVKAEVINGSGVQPAKVDVEKNRQGYLVSILALPSQIGQPFMTNQPTSIVKLTFTPTKPGPLMLDFDAEKSLATVHQSDPVKDELKHVAQYRYELVAQAPPNCAYTYGAWGNCANGKQTRSVTKRTPDNCVETTKVTEQNCTSSGTTTTTQPTPTPSGNQNIGGVSTKQCNEVCNSNAECGANHWCYNNRCRLVGYEESASCQTYNKTAGTPDQGLDFACNEYCANTEECASEFTCYYNRCRRPDNPESTSCSAPTPQQLTATRQACNSSCTSDDQCASGLRCLNGSCRLATNPSSTSCQAVTVASVTSTYYPEELDDDSTLTTETGDDLDSESTLLADTSVVESSPTPRPSGTPRASATPRAKARASATAAAGANNWLLPAVGIGAGVAILGGGYWWLRRRRAAGPAPMPQATSAAPRIPTSAAPLSPATPPETVVPPLSVPPTPYISNLGPDGLQPPER